MGLETVFILLVTFQAKHFIADYLLQYSYMMRKVDVTWKFLAPLSIHCGVHALFTLVICLFWSPQLWWLALLDFVVHFLMDRMRSGPKYLGRFNDPAKHSFWISLGLDQMVHHLTHYYIIWHIYTAFQ